MTTESPQDPPPPPEVGAISPEILDQIRRVSVRDRRCKVLIAALITILGVGASIMSCIGQSFTYRQARALEGIELQLREIRASCTIKQP